MEDPRSSIRRNFFKLQPQGKQKCEQFMVSLRKKRKQALFKSCRDRRQRSLEADFARFRPAGEGSEGSKEAVEEILRWLWEMKEGAERSGETSREKRLEFCFRGVWDERRLDFILEQIGVRDYQVGGKVIEALALVCSLQQDGIKCDGFLEKVADSREVVSFLDSCCSNFIEPSQTENCLEICRTLSFYSENFHSSISLSQGYFKCLIRFCQESNLETEEDKEFVDTLINLIYPMFDRYQEDSLYLISDCLKALCEHPCALKEFFENNSKMVRVSLICLNFQKDEIYKRYIDTFLTLLRHISDDCLEILLESGLLKCLNTLLTKTLSPLNETQKESLQKTYQILNLILCRSRNHTNQIFQHHLLSHITTSTSSLTLLHLLPIKRNLLLNLPRQQKLLLLKSPLFTPTLIKTLPLCRSPTETQLCLELFKNVLETLLNHDFSYFSGLLKSTIMAICESPVVMRI